MNSCMKAKCLFLSCWFLVCFALTVQGQDTLTVMSYNIYHAENPETAQSTISEIGSFINNIEPDFVALQEIDEQTNRLAKINDGNGFSLTDSLANLTSMSGYFAKAINFDDGEYGTAILSQKSAKPHKIKLPNPRKGEPRVLSYLHTQTSLDTEVIFANVHLDHQHQENRLAQVKKLNEILRNQNKPVIMAGDFNFTPDSQSYDLMKAHWVDAASLFQDDPASTYPSNNPVKRIDYVFLSRNADWEIIDVEVLGLSHSDHLPIVAKVVISDK